MLARLFEKLLKNLGILVVGEVTNKSRF